MSSTKSRSKSSTTARAEADSRRRRIPVFAVAFATIALLLIVVLVFAGGSGVAGDELGAPTVTGDPLPLFGGDAAADPAAGLRLPEITGEDFDGAMVRITNDGVPKAIAVFAHWCPVCQSEVPEVQAWIDAGGVPTGVAVYSISTSVGSTRPNYPPSDWFEREGWTPPVLKDDVDLTVVTALGVSGYPFWLFVDADGTVQARTAGAIDIPAVQRLLELMAPAG
jgi:hypothetical protein